MNLERGGRGLFQEGTEKSQGKTPYD